MLKQRGFRVVVLLIALAGLTATYAQAGPSIVPPTASDPVASPFASANALFERLTSLRFAALSRWLRQFSPAPPAPIYDGNGLTDEPDPTSARDDAGQDGDDDAREQQEAINNAKPSRTTGVSIEQTPESNGG